MAKSSRKLIEEKCHELGLEIISLEYDPAIVYDSGGWEVLVRHPKYDDSMCAAHTFQEILDELDRDFGPVPS